MENNNFNKKSLQEETPQEEFVGKPEENIFLDLSDEELDHRRNERSKLFQEGKTLVQYQLPELVVVETGDILEQQSRDIAEKNLDKDQENLKKSGLKGFIKNIWKHNITKEYTRQLEINKVRENLLETGNIYAGEDSEPDYNLDKAQKDAMNALIERFAYQDEMGNTLEHQEAGEKREETNLEGDFKNIMYDYIKGNITQDEFIAQKSQYLKDIIGENYSDNKLKFVDNILEIVDNLKVKFDHESSIVVINQDILDLDMILKVKLGELNKVIIAREAKLGVRTEAQYTKVDKIIEWVKKTPVGHLVDSGTMSLAVGMASSVIGSVAQGITKSAAVGAGIVGLGAGVAGGIAAMKESDKLTNERRQHNREMAKGGEIQTNSKRREELEKYRYETKSAQSLTQEIDQYLGEDMKLGNKESIEQFLSDIESRILISDTNKIDLISYSRFDQIEQERTALDIGIAKLKIKLKKFNDEQKKLIVTSPQEIDYETKLNKRQQELLFKDSEIIKKDRLFQKMRNKKMGAAFVKGALTSLVAGAVAQEGIAFFDDKKDGVIEGLMNKSQESEYSITPLEKLREYITGKLEEGKEIIEKIVPKHISLENTEINISSDKYDLVDLNQDEIYHLVDSNDNVVHPDVDIQFLEDGSISKEVISELQNRGINVTQDTFAIPTGESMEQTLTIDEYMESQGGLKVEYSDYATNNTDFADGNELGLDYGVNDKGEVVLKLNMTEEGSVTTAGERINVLNEMSEGKVKVAFYADSALDKKALVLMEVDGNGDIIVPEHIRNNFFDDEGEFIGGRMQVIVDRNNADTEVFESIAIAGLEGKGITEAVIEEPIMTYQTKISFDLPLDSNMIETDSLTNNKILEAPLNLPIYEMYNTNSRLETMNSETAQDIVKKDKEPEAILSQEKVYQSKLSNLLAKSLEYDGTIVKLYNYINNNPEEFKQDLKSNWQESIELINKEVIESFIRESGTKESLEDLANSFRKFKDKKQFIYQGIELDFRESNKEHNPNGSETINIKSQVLEKQNKDAYILPFDKDSIQKNINNSLEIEVFINNLKNKLTEIPGSEENKESTFGFKRSLDPERASLIAHFSELREQAISKLSEKSGLDYTKDDLSKLSLEYKELVKFIKYCEYRIDNKSNDLSYDQFYIYEYGSNISIKIEDQKYLVEKGYDLEDILYNQEYSANIKNFESVLDKFDKPDLSLSDKEILVKELGDNLYNIYIIIGQTFEKNIPVKIFQDNSDSAVRRKQEIFNQMFETNEGKTGLYKIITTLCERFNNKVIDIIESLSKDLEDTAQEDKFQLIAKKNNYITQLQDKYSYTLLSKTLEQTFPELSLQVDKYKSGEYIEEYIAKYIESEILLYQDSLNKLSQENLVLEDRDQLIYNLDERIAKIRNIMELAFINMIPVEIRMSSKESDIAKKQEIFNQMFETEEGKTEVYGMFKYLFENYNKAIDDMMKILDQELETASPEEKKSNDELKLLSLNKRFAVIMIDNIKIFEFKISELQ